MQNPKETAPESSDAARSKDLGERQFDAVSKNSGGAEFGAWPDQTDRDKRRWANIEADVLKSFGLDPKGITIPFPKPPTK